MSLLWIGLETVNRKDWNPVGSGVGGEAPEVFPRRGGRMKVVDV